MKVKQKPGDKGSLQWIQAVVDQPAALNRAIRARVGLAPHVELEWRSPLASDDWAEYRDAAFLQRLGLDYLIAPLARFWPRRGPQWDALALASTGEVLLVEAKAHVNELRSTCKASPASRAKIQRALTEAKLYFMNDGDVGGPSSEEEWRKALAPVEATLRVSDAAFPAVHRIFLDVRTIRKS